MRLPFLFLVGVGAFLSGVFVSSLIWIPNALLGAFFLFGGACALVYSLLNFFAGAKKFSKDESGKKIFVLGLCIFFFALGAARYQQKFLAIEKGDLRRYADTASEGTLVGFVAEPPQELETIIRFPFLAEEAAFQGVSSAVRGRILVIASRYPVYSYGEKLKVSGRLEAPQEFGGFAYKNYLAARGIEATIAFPETESLGDTRSGFLFLAASKLFALKAGLQEGISMAFSPPQSAVAEAVLFGDESGMSKEFKDTLNVSGLRHITAVSGMNITIISRMLFLLGLAIGFWRNHAFYFAVSVLVLYILMIGAPASAVRAGIMGAVLLLAQHVGRPNDAGRAILFASALMVAVNPLSFPYDVGFQLSFLAILGIVYWEGFFQQRLSFLPNPKFLPMRSLAAMTLSAQLFTLPILLYNFGQISLVSLVTNMFVVQLLPFLMVLSFVAALAGFVPSPAGIFFVFPAWLLTTYLVKVAEFSSTLPFAAMRFADIPFFLVPVSYLFLGWITWRIQKTQKLKFLEY